MTIPTAKPSTAVSARIDDNIAQRVLEALWSHPWIVPSHVDIRVEDGLLTLNGQVTSALELIAIEEVLEAISCVDRMENRLEVAGAQAFADAA
jgi:osmotically-inducible protein OsmY